MPAFATLGPAGSNHDLNARRYVAFHGLGARVDCVGSFDEAFARMQDGRAGFVVQACLHPQVGDSIGRHRDRFPLVDCFLGPTAPMAVLVRRDAAPRGRIGFMPATRVYFDPSPWTEQVSFASGSDVATALLEGRIDAGFTDRGWADRRPDVLRVEMDVGPVDVAWLVYGSRRVCGDGIVADPQAPVVRQFRP
ncbi:MAG TPA: hypothetical protein VEA40_27690 [Ramlibacter sp.]|nr:hypothetical protein [Ramlibacter sp.]